MAEGIQRSVAERTEKDGKNRVRGEAAIRLGLLADMYGPKGLRYYKCCYTFRILNKFLDN